MLRRMGVLFVVAAATFWPLGYFVFGNEALPEETKLIVLGTYFALFATFGNWYVLFYKGK